MPTVKLTTGNVHYREQGKGQPLLFLHANPGDCQDFSAVIPTLAKGYRVLTLDWPGYGKSDLPDSPREITLVFFHNVLEEFIAALGLEQLILVGNSLGGLCAVYYAAHHANNVKALVLVSPGGFTPHNLFSKAFCRLQASRFSLSPETWSKLYLRKRNPSTEAMIERSGTQQSCSERLLVNRMVWHNFLSPQADMRELARGIHTPTLLIFGERDPAIPARRDGREATKAFPNATLKTFPCGHAAFAEMPGEFCQAVLGFIERHGIQ